MNLATKKNRYSWSTKYSFNEYLINFNVKFSCNKQIAKTNNKNSKKRKYRMYLSNKVKNSLKIANFENQIIKLY